MTDSLVWFHFPRKRKEIRHKELQRKFKDHLYVADPATSPASNRVLAPCFPLRTARLLTYGNIKILSLRFFLHSVPLTLEAPWGTKRVHSAFLTSLILNISVSLKAYYMKLGQD